jgi:hypothetical protein
MHPVESPKARFAYKSGFAACAALMVALVVWQGVRNGKSQSVFKKSVDDAADAAKHANGRIDQLQQEQKAEIARREQAEKDLAVIMQGVGRSTTEGVVSGIKQVSQEQLSTVSVDLVYESQQLKIYDRGQASLSLWGTQLDNGLKAIDKEPRMISPSGNHPFGLGDGFYYLKGDALEKYLLSKFGKDGSGTVPLKLFVEDQTHRKHTVKGLLVVTVSSGAVKIETQNLGVTDGW